MKDKQLHELLSQALETELGGAEVYETALRCVRHDDLASEFEEYLKQTKRRAEIVRGLLASLGLDEAAEPPGRKVVHHLGKSLAKAMEMALAADSPETAELVAAECVVLAQTKDHLNGNCSPTPPGTCKVRRTGHSRRRSARSSLRRANTSTTRPGGAASWGWPRPACPQSCRPRRSKST